MNLTEVIHAIFDIYTEQNLCYRNIRQAVEMESEAISRKDVLELLELIDVEEKHLQRVSALAITLKQLRSGLQHYLPGQHFSLDQLICLAEPTVVAGLKAVMSENKQILAEIEQIKERNARQLQWFLQSAQRFREVI